MAVFVDINLHESGFWNGGKITLNDNGSGTPCKLITNTRF